MKNIFWVVIILFLFLLVVYYFLFNRKLYSSPNIIRENQHITTDKLMIVAHPDDELIFGGKELIQEKGWKVVCVTNGSAKSKCIFSIYSANTRKTEFMSVMDALDCQYEIWDYEDYGFNANWNEKLLLENLQRVINEKNYKKIVTHNLNGEYGHVQHKKISELVHTLKPNNLYVFGYKNKLGHDSDKKNCANDYVCKLNELLKLYTSQKNTVGKYYTNILQQSICKVNF